MKRLNQEVTCEGKLETITMMELRSRPGEIMTAVQLGKVYIIERNGFPMAILSKPPGKELVTLVNPKGELSYKL